MQGMIEAGEKLQSASSARRGVKFTFVVLLFSIPGALLLLLRLVAYQPFNIPSTSNEPSMMLGDYIFVSKLAYRFGDPERGDIAVFKYPADTNIDYVKRVVGLPGDRIQMKDGVVYLNGKPLPQEELAPLNLSYNAGPMTLYRETLPDGRSYVIGNMTDVGSVDNTAEYLVPAGHYFALGDNRDNSQDSRFLDLVGYIPRANFVGRYAFRFWNSAGIPLTGRPEEIYPKQ